MGRHFTFSTIFTPLQSDATEECTSVQTVSSEASEPQSGGDILVYSV